MIKKLTVLVADMIEIIHKVVVVNTEASWYETIVIFSIFFVQLCMIISGVVLIIVVN